MGLVQKKGWQCWFPTLAEPTDCGGEIIDAGKVAAAKRLAVDDGEEYFDQVEQDAEVGVKCSSMQGAKPARQGWDAIRATLGRSCHGSRPARGPAAGSTSA